MPLADKNTEIAIIGAGFSGLMTAVNLVKNAVSPLTIHLLNDNYDFGKGPAYSTNSIKHVLNVPAAKMSCLADEPDHFLDWAHRLPKYREQDREVLGKAFLPRMEFGQYLLETWQDALANKRADTIVNVVNGKAIDIEKALNKHFVKTSLNNTIAADYIVLATGNEAPQNPVIENNAFYASPDYFANPWQEAGVKGFDPQKDILILGNGLTMVDTVISIMDNGFKGTIHTISSKGFAVMPHRFNFFPYQGLVNELNGTHSLSEIFSLINKHIRLLAKLGISGEPVIDSLRPLTHDIWQNLSEEDKKRFMQTLVPRWYKLRHRMAGHIYDYLVKLQLEGRLIANKGKMIDAAEDGNGIKATIQRKNEKQPATLHVARIINCTGPDPDISRSANPLLQNLLAKGMIQPDSLKIGMEVTDKWTLINAKGEEEPNLYTLGINLRGKYWESTAVPELKVQAHKLANEILARIQVLQLV
jgi:uncharacterized NAD(P)/FAD-binding protein YdhS